MIIRINFKKKKVRVIKRTVRINFSNPVAMLSEILYKVNKLQKENKELKEENMWLKSEMISRRDAYTIAAEYTEELEHTVDELEKEINNLKESFNYVEHMLSKIKGNKPKKSKAKKSSLLLDSSHESDESILFEVSQNYKEYLTRDEEGYHTIDWFKLENRVGRPIQGDLSQESYWGYPILNEGKVITDDDVKGLKSDIFEAQVSARRG